MTREQELWYAQQQQNMIPRSYLQSPGQAPMSEMYAEAVQEWRESTKSRPSAPRKGGRRAAQKLLGIFSTLWKCWRGK